MQRQAQDAQEQLFRFRFQMGMGQIEGLKKYRNLKKDRARMLTVLQREGRRSTARMLRAVVTAAPPANKKKQPASNKERRRIEGSETDHGGRQQSSSRPTKTANKNEKVGEVVSTKMAKTIVVEVTRRVPPSGL